MKKITISGKIWSFVFLLASILLTVKVFITKCDNKDFIPKETSFCGVVNIDVVYYGILSVLLLISFYFSIRSISCALSNLNKQEKLICSINTDNVLIVVMFLLGFFIFLFSVYGYFLNRSICSKSEIELKKIKLMELNSYVELSYENSGYYPYYYSEKVYPDSFQDMVDNGTLSEDEVVDFKRNGFEVIAINSDDNYFIEASFFRKEKRYPCEDKIEIVKTYYCNKNHCMLN
ncbi:MAG: hypothetical protein P1P85_03330 [Patescibacteria group bacterium]|nr:hypothetical protein [Patescibacteria group bacterium]